MKNIHNELRQGVEDSIHLAMGGTQGYQACLDRLRIMVRFDREDARSLLVEWDELDRLLSHRTAINVQVREMLTNKMIGYFTMEPIFFGPARRFRR